MSINAFLQVMVWWFAVDAAMSSLIIVFGERGEAWLRLLRLSVLAADVFFAWAAYSLQHA